MNIAIFSEGFSKQSLLLQPWHRIYDISKRIANHKDYSVLIITNKTGSSPDTENIEGITVIRVNQMTFDLSGKKELSNILAKNNIDIIVWCGTTLSGIHLNQLKNIGLPVIWDIDMDVQFLNNLEKLSFRELFHPGHNFLFPLLLAMIGSKSITKSVANSSLISRIIVPSQAIKNSMCKIGVNSNKIMVIPSATEKTSFSQLNNKEKETLRSELGYSKTDFIVTYFGSSCTMRGTDTSILSMKRVLAANKHVKLMLLSRRKTGRDSNLDRHFECEEEYLKKLVKRMGIESNVQIIPGIIGKAKLRSYLLMCDAIVLPFKHVFSEPPLSVLEAMSLGKTVITTRLGTLSEIIGDDKGILVKPNSPNSLAQAIIYLSNHPEKLAPIGEKAQRYVADLPDWDQVTFSFEELLNKTFQETGMKTVERMC